ncbi:hypothetical protein GWI33_007592 [Rhynchophorus ferrugineus]|uniref:Uncharacterized protein n=1 Tax=Rhynchophorus ferrugineus TaxID=354439 RepID=A0A834IIP3_RHYFE|nr:hypothetical protein GWI33_007592 [Rhynchophorus ferrugineus]
MVHARRSATKKFRHSRGEGRVVVPPPTHKHTHAFSGDLLYPPPLSESSCPSPVYRPRVLGTSPSGRLVTPAGRRGPAKDAPRS